MVKIVVERDFFKVRPVNVSKEFFWSVLYKSGRGQFDSGGKYILRHVEDFMTRGF